MPCVGRGDSEALKEDCWLTGEENCSWVSILRSTGSGKTVDQVPKRCRMAGYKLGCTCLYASQKTSGKREEKCLTYSRPMFLTMLSKRYNEGNFCSTGTSIIRAQMASAMPSPWSRSSPAMIVRSVMMGLELKVSSESTTS